jgi:hypothetical protein
MSSISSRSVSKTCQAFFAALAAARAHFPCSMVAATPQRTRQALIRVSFALRGISE